MGAKTGIQWADATVNPTSGCDGCELWPNDVKGGPCYAGNLQVRRLSKTLPDLYSPNFTEVRMIRGRMAKAAALSDLRGKARPGEPWMDGMPRIIFVGDLGDIFSRAVTFEFLKRELIDVVTSSKGAWHVWMILTKRPGRLIAFAEWLGLDRGVAWPANLWSGTSITGRASVSRANVLSMLVGTRFVSLEPLTEEVDLKSVLYDLAGPPIDLAIIGGESGQGEHHPRPFDIEWARGLIRETRGTATRAFVKQLGSHPVWSPASGPCGLWPQHVRFDYARDGEKSRHRMILADGHGGDWDEWPADLRVREIPEVALCA